ncbi:triose-phosphate isomerase [Catenovulum maritimum]|uniref:Triosephosphate isomerase n=1 Tax=Catenovulum maritimum TaxID=1513271 RepID=A0A0J8GSB1_9ALTE|nr:triose-phosphate isomerase [Catenovulum maritimum]KMT65690.1 triosephosphate isomerase [Catenovulum maritimum]
MKSRKPIVIANWKLNGGFDLLCSSVASFVKKSFLAEVYICPPYLYIRDLLHFLQYSVVNIGSQNVSKYQSGAYTGETSAQMLAEAGCKLCLIGHSERRSMFRENNASCQIKLKRAFENNLMPVLCIGENLEEKNAGITKDILSRQINESFEALDIADNSFCIAYEPVWAIGTGQAATPETAQEVHAYIREQLVSLFGQDKAQQIRILYGGSVTKLNTTELLTQPDIDGLLVGGASLDAEHFMSICQQVDKFAMDSNS